MNGQTTLTEFLTKVGIQEEETCDDILDCEISDQEVRNAIRHLKAGKSAGPDCILAEMLKVAEPVIVPYLKNIFNVLFDKGMLPKEWSKAIIIPLHKKGDKNNPDNYRGISLLSILSKVFTHIINSRPRQDRSAWRICTARFTRTVFDLSLAWVSFFCV